MSYYIMDIYNIYIHNYTHTHLVFIPVASQLWLVFYLPYTEG